ncbi:MAG: metallophosphatase domain-containing protein [Colwellia sp.]|nr:metallophosphatase domain-containing protein [Colwellia sp.]
MNKKLKCVAIADTHGMYNEIEIPDGDVLIHAGDITRHGKLSELNDFNDWLGEQPHKHKIIIAGNHDWCFERQKEASLKILTNAVYLEDQSIVIEGHNFYGSPWQPTFQNWAFNLERGKAIQKKWDLISNDIDVLITHGPVFGILDKIFSGENVGCENLLSKVEEIKPKVHVCGHIHEGYGEVVCQGIKFINASVTNVHYQPTNAPIVFTLN